MGLIFAQDPTDAADFEAIVSGSAETPERNLMLAVLEDAVRAYRKNAHVTSPRGRELYAEAAAWFAAPRDGYLYSFRSICGYLRIAPTWFLRRLRHGQPTDVRGYRTVFQANSGHGMTAARITPWTHRVRRGRPRVNRNVVWGVVGERSLDG